MSNDQQQLQKTLELESLILRGPNGEKQIELAAGPNGPAFVMFDTAGTPRVEIGVESGAVVLRMNSESGHKRVNLSAIDGEREDAEISFYSSELDDESLPEALASIGCS